MVARASLHNQEELKRKDVRIGDWVEIVRAGGVIPKVQKVIIEKRGNEVGKKPFEFPSTCPACGSAVRKVEGYVALRCENRDCPAQRIARLRHFVSREAFDIEGLGEKSLAGFCQEDLLSEPHHIFQLHKEDTRKKILALEGWQDKSLNNLLVNIEQRRSMPFASLLYALGIPSVGATRAREIAVRARRKKLTFKNLSEQARRVKKGRVENVWTRIIKLIFRKLGWTRITKLIFRKLGWTRITKLLFRKLGKANTQSSKGSRSG